jgi:hypothetical protein
LNDKVNDGWVMYLDDDDEFTDENALSTIASRFYDENNLILWRTQIGALIIPNDTYFGEKPEPCEISGIAFCFHSKHKNIVNWTNWKRADYRVIAELYKHLKPVWIDAILTKTQNGLHGGNGQDKNEKIFEVELKLNPEMRERKQVRVLNSRRLAQPINEIIWLSEPVANYFERKSWVTFDLEIEKPKPICSQEPVIESENITVLESIPEKKVEKKIRKSKKKSVNL